MLKFSFSSALYHLGEQLLFLHSLSGFNIHNKVECLPLKNGYRNISINLCVSPLYYAAIHNTCTCVGLFRDLGILCILWRYCPGYQQVLTEECESGQTAIAFQQHNAITSPHMTAQLNGNLDNRLRESLRPWLLIQQYSAFYVVCLCVQHSQGCVS